MKYNEAYLIPGVKLGGFVFKNFDKTDTDGCTISSLCTKDEWNGISPFMARDVLQKENTSLIFLISTKEKKTFLPKL